MSYPKTERYWEIDVLRGAAIVMMVAYHLFYDLVFFGYYRPMLSGGWHIFQQVIANLFILLVGVSLVLSHARLSRRERGWSLFRHFLWRGLKLLGLGLAITLVSWVYMGRVVILFGILHLIGTAIILTYPFLSRSLLTNLAVGFIIIALSFYLRQLPPASPWLMPLGLGLPAGFMLDHFPLFPWFGVALLGLSIGQAVYPGGLRRFDLPDLGGFLGMKGLAWLGRHSLLIYLLHQPLLIAALQLLL